MQWRAVLKPASWACGSSLCLCGLRGRHNTWFHSRHWISGHNHFRAFLFQTLSIISHSAYSPYPWRWRGCLSVSAVVGLSWGSSYLSWKYYWCEGAPNFGSCCPRVQCEQPNSSFNWDKCSDDFFFFQIKTRQDFYKCVVEYWTCLFSACCIIILFILFYYFCLLPFFMVILFSTSQLKQAYLLPCLFLLTCGADYF